MGADNSTSIHDLLDQADWLRALARGLVTDGDELDDVQQDVWLRALKAPRAGIHDQQAWLARVTHRRVAEIFRTRVRRARREAAAAVAETVPSNDRLVEEAELQRELVDAVLALAEPYRSTILLRFYRGLSPSEIAAKEGVPAATIRSRSCRAIAQLRDRLDRRFEGRRDAWMGLLAPLASVPSRATISTSSLAALAVGGWIMKVVLGVAAGLLVGGAVVAFRWVGAGDPDTLTVPVAIETRTDAEAPTPERANDVSAPAAPTRRIVEDAANSRSADPSSAAGAYDHVGFVGTQDRQRLGGATITVLWTTPDGAEAAERVMTSRADGSFDIPEDLPRDGSRRLLASHPGYVPLAQALTKELPILALAPATRFEGYVTDGATGGPIGGVTVHVGNSIGRIVSDASGFYSDDGVAKASKVLVVAIAPGRSPFRESVAIEADTPVQRHDIILPVAPTFHGRAVDLATGDPVAGARLSVNYDFAETGPDGSFRFAATNSKAEIHLRKRGYCIASFFADPALVPNGDLGNVPLVRACRVEGRVVDADGHPLIGAQIRVGVDASRGMWQEIPSLDPPPRGNGRVVSGMGGTIRTNEEGRFEIGMLSPYHAYLGLSVSHASFSGVRRTGPFSFERPGEVRVEDVRIASAATLKGIVRGASPSNRARIDYVSDGQSGSTTCDDAGTFRVDLLDAGTYRVTARTFSPQRAEMREVSAEHGETIHLAFDFSEPAVVVRGRVLDAGGQPSAALVQVLVPNTTPTVLNWPFRAASDGTFERAVEAEPGELVDVRVESQGAWQHFVAYAGAENARDYVLLPVGRIRLTCPEVDSVVVRWRPAGSSGEFGPTRVESNAIGSFEVYVPVGSVDLQVTANGFAPSTVESISVFEGSTAETDVPLRRSDE